jgi:hypothetical protein
MIEKLPIRSKGVPEMNNSKNLDVISRIKTFVKTQRYIKHNERYVKFHGFKSVDEYLTHLEMRNISPQYVMFKNATYYPCNGRPLVNSGLYSDNGDIIKESCLFRGTHKSEMITGIKSCDTSLGKIYLLE